MSNYKVDILTPSSVLGRDMEASELLIPTVRGQINVLEDHTHIVSELDTGTLTLKTSNGSRHFHLTQGICKVLNKKVTILAGVSEEDVNIDLDRAKAALKNAKAKLNGMDPLTDSEFRKFFLKVKRAENRIMLAEKNKKS